MQSIPVKYEKGVFIPLETLQEIDEGVIGEVHIKEADKVEAIK
jgi:predicted DNA-binding antitoxin AbrB/MazE fold protein